MPDLNSPPTPLLDSSDAAAPKKKFSRGIRPDHIARGEVLAPYVPVDNERQTANKQVTEVSLALAMREQIVISEKVKSKLSQSEAKVEPNLGQTGNKRVTSGVQTDPKQLTETPVALANREQAVSEPVLNLGQGSGTLRTDEADVSNSSVQTEPQEEKIYAHGSNEVRTNLGQTQDKAKSEPRTNSGQSSDELRTQAELVISETVKSSDKLKTKLRTEPRTNLGQSSDELRTNASYMSLVGLQREVVLFIYDQLKITLEKVTPPIAVSYLAESCKTSVLSVQKTIQRLERIGFVRRCEFKNGRSGWTRYGLGENLYGEILQNESSDKLRTNLGQSSDKLKTELRTQLRTSVPIVVVPNLNSSNTTNTQATDEPCFVIPNELSGKVSRRQLSEFVLQGKISESDLQLSLDAFAYDLKNKLVASKYSSNPVALLIGAIKNNGSYNSAKYVEALKSELKPFIQAQRETTAEKADLKNSKEWAEFQKFKAESPESYKNFEEKMANFGFKGDLLEDFTFLEFKKSVLQINEETNLNPLRPVDGTAS